ncbi:MAG: alpha/beta hydrolase [Bdellovibrionaceae bacterium]|nr:alpha/beta hydrolase [Pseudobdellovibrionaceae bacterium]
MSLRFLLFSVLAFGLSGCMSLVYYPSEKTFFDPAKVGLLKEEVEFKIDSGETIHAWWFLSPQKKIKGTFVFFHGNAENLTSHFANLLWLPQAGYNYLIFDYPGYGRSTGRPNPQGNLKAGIAAVDWVAKNKDSGPLIIYGQSLGGNVALRTVLEIKERQPIRAVIIDSSFPSYQKIAARKLSHFWLTWIFQPLAYVLMSDTYAPKEIDRISPIPLLVIHGQQDIQVEPEFGDEIYRQAKEPKELWKIQDGFHGSTFWRHDLVYRQKLLDYLDAHP